MNLVYLAARDKYRVEREDKGYMLRFRGKIAEKPRYTGRILLVGIGYDKKTKQHACQVEVVSQE